MFFKIEEKLSFPRNRYILNFHNGNIDTLERYRNICFWVIFIFSDAEDFRSVDSTIHWTEGRGVARHKLPECQASLTLVAQPLHIVRV